MELLRTWLHKVERKSRTHKDNLDRWGGPLVIIMVVMIIATTATRCSQIHLIIYPNVKHSKNGLLKTNAFDTYSQSEGMHHTLIS